MLNIAGRYSLEAESAHTALSSLHRGRRTSDGAAIVAKLQRAEYPTPLELARIRHEHDLLQSLGLPHVGRALSLEKFGNGLALVLEDPGELALATLIARGQLDLPTRLAIAHSLASLLASLHARQIVHNDIRPQHFFLDPARPSELTLIDFGRATRLAHTQESASLADLEGSLPYMAPEQSGRMNRVIDRRSDLYSLGATLYELFTGNLPFDSLDPLELIHCHIARVPPAPDEVNPAIPEVVARIILKLLAKTPEERYQSAAGLAHDLARCLRELEGTGMVPDFELGERDASGELSIPQRLYGRDRELERLHELLALARRGKSHLLLLSGHSGVGKSALVHELQRGMASRGYLACGKFDYLNRGVPYSAVAEACRALVQALLMETPAVLAERARVLSEALGANASVMIDLVPALELVIGPQATAPVLGPVEAQQRFEGLFESFVATFARPDQPLVFFFDDLQWADPGSLRLLHLLFSGQRANLLVIGAYRNREVDGAHPLRLLLDDLSRAGAPMSELGLGPLQRVHILELLADTLGQRGAELEALADVLIDKTQGNPFFLSQFLHTLNRDGALVFAHDNGRWQWSIERIKRHMSTDNVVDFMLGRLRKLSAATQRVLRVAACVGHQFDTNTLAVVADETRHTLHEALWEALQSGLLVPLDSNYRYTMANGRSESTAPLNANYRFLHDRVQQAAYELIAEAERGAVHLSLGRTLLAACAGEPRDKALFEIVDHMNRGRRSIASRPELRRLAELNLAAGRRARDAAAALAAVRYLGICLELLGENAWSEDYAACYSAHLLLTECQLLSGELAGCTRSLDAIETHVHDTFERIAARALRMRLHLTQGKLDEACAFSVDTLRLLGVDLPDPRDKAALGACIGAEFGAYQAALAGRSIESLAELPPMTDPIQLAVVDVFFRTVPVAFQSNQELAVAIQLKAVQLPLAHGTAPLSPFFYAQYGIVHGVVTGDLGTAYRFGELAIELAKRPEHRLAAGAVNFIFGGFIAHWCRHISVSYEHFRVGLRTSLETGDHMHAPYCATIDVIYRLLAGEALSDILKLCRDFEDMVTRLDDVINRGFLRICSRAAEALSGNTASLTNLNGEGFDEQAFERTAPPPVLAIFVTVKAMLHGLVGDFAQSLAICESARPLPAMFYIPTLRFYHGLSLLRLASVAEAPTRPALLERAALDIADFERWSTSSAHNYAHYRDLLLAERAALAGQTAEAMALYDQAITSARDNGYIHLQAFGNELCARFHSDAGRSKIARPYLAEADYAYRRWGARAKAEQLRRQYPELFADAGVALARGGQASPAGTTEGDAAQASIGRGIDLSTAIRATQAIATELVLEKVLERVMRSLVENAGAQRGHLVLNRAGALLVEAAITIDPAEVRLGINQSAESSGDLSSSVVQYVARTQAPIVLANAIEDTRFAGDPYIMRQKPRSVLCVPMLHQGKLSGVLYLENNLAVDAFSAERAELLQFLAAQAAVAVENARLYGDLNAANARLVQANTTLEAQVAERTEELQRTLSELWSEMDLARKIQRVLLPTQIDVPHFEVAAQMTAADSVGGDYYDVLQVNGRTWLTIGDVSGHGVSAGLVMMMVQTAVRSVLTASEGSELRPSSLLGRVNAAIRSNLERISENQYMTATVLELDGGNIVYSGLHQDILVYRKASARVECIETRGTWLGIVDEMAELLHDDSLQLGAGDTMLLFTDGLTELRQDGKMLGTNGLAAKFEALSREGLDVRSLVQTLMPDTATPADDMTLLAVRYCPTPAGDTAC